MMMARAVRFWSRLWNPVRGVPDRFWSALDSDAVRVYQSTVYSLVFVAGWYNLLFGIPKTLDHALYDNVQYVWVAMCIAGPPVTLAGALWERHDKYVAGLAQASGNSAIGFVLLAYVAAVVQENWGSGVFAPFIFIGLGAWSLLLMLRDLRKTIRTEQRMRSS